MLEEYNKKERQFFDKAQKRVTKTEARMITSLGL